MTEAYNVIKLNITRPNLLFHYLDETTADVFFICSDGPENGDNVMKVPAHKIILASVSDVFHTMFYGQLPEKNEIEMTDTTTGGLKQFLHLFYKKEVICTTDHVHEVLHLADKYNVPEWSLACCKFLIERGHESFKTTNFLNCSQTILRTILGNVYLKGEGENLFKACMDWAENACRLLDVDGSMENRRKVLGDCLDLIEFASIKRSAAVEYLKDYQSLFMRHELDYILQLISERVTAHDDLRSSWPSYVSRAETMELEKGRPYKMRFTVDQRCLLYNIAFSITGKILSETVNLVVSIEKNDMNSNTKRKIFVGTLSHENAFTRDGFHLMPTRFPDVIVIESNTEYVIEITPFENMNMQCFGTNFQYFEDADECSFRFADLNFAFLKVAAI